MRALNYPLLISFSFQIVHMVQAITTWEDSVDFNLEGEQWSPVYGTENQWVLIGRKYENLAFTCMMHHDLEGSYPDWGLTRDNASAKLHIMCCLL